MILKKYNYKYILSIGLILFIIIINLSIITKAETIEYEVYDLSVGDTGKEVVFEYIDSFENFDEAKEEMLEYENGVITHAKNPSPLKIVAASRGQAQSFPYRPGHENANVTLKIFNNKNLTDRHTYIPAHYMMYVYDYFLSNGRIVADIEIQGGRGYVDIVKTDIIPMIYIENGIQINLGGNGTYNADSKKVYSIRPYQEEYRVYENDGVKEINVKAVRPYPGLSLELTYGAAPDFLERGQVYYSPDGIRFFTDRDLENQIGDEYYSYFQWLPLRTMTNHSPESFENFLDYYGKYDSVMMNETYHFIEQGIKYGMNPVLIFQQANLESAYGTSSYAKNRKNVFGWRAVDSNPDLAESYKNIGEAIAIHMDKQIAGYMKVDDWRHFGPSFGNKSAGITVSYASDPYYGIKIAGMYYRMDKINGFKDLNAYDLSLLEDGRTYTVRNEATDREWYTTRRAMKNQIIVNLGERSGRIKTIPWMTNSKGTLDAYGEFAYIEDNISTIKGVKAYGTKGKLPDKPDFGEIAYEDPVNAKTTDNLNIRRSYSTSSNVLGTILSGTKILVEPTSIGWARTTYKGVTGFVSMDYIELLDDEPSEYKKGDINGDGVIDGFDMMEIKRHYLGIKELKGDQFEAADINKDGVVDGFDMMEIKRHYLGIKEIKE